MKSPKKAGFVFLSLPLDQIAPLSLLAKAGNGIVSRTGASLRDLFPEKKYPLPPLTKDGKLPKDISGEEELDMKVEANIKFLEGLASLTRTKLDAGIEAGRSRKCIFTIQDPLLDLVSSFEIDKYISGNPLSDSITTFEHLFKKDDLYLVTEVIKSRSFEINYDSDISTGSHASVTVEKMVEAGGKAEFTKQNKQTMKSGDNGPLLAIAIKAVQLLYDKKWWQSKKDAKYRINLNPNIVEARGPEDMECNYLDAEEGVINSLK